MKCHHCDNQATVHLTQILNGQMHKMDLCETCAQEKGVTNPENLSIGSLMDQDSEVSDASLSPMTCESCGTTHSEFKKGGRLGCEACYHVFRPVLDPLLEGMHAGSKHLGKIPSSSQLKVEFQQSMVRLRSDLQNAIEQEDYEEAARIRDQLKDLENKSNSQA